MTRTYRFTSGADKDVEAIYRYTLQQWGVEQADKYNASVHAKCESLVDRPHQGRPRPEFSPDLRSLRFENHSVFYRLAPDFVEILAVLHDSQDAAPIVTGRLRDK